MPVVSCAWLAGAVLLGTAAAQAARAAAPDWTSSGYAGSAMPPHGGVRSFAGLPWTSCLHNEQVRFDVALLGMPFDGGVSYRPGYVAARRAFGPACANSCAEPEPASGRRRSERRRGASAQTRGPSSVSRTRAGRQAQ
jgi:hypothetical protein